MRSSMAVLSTILLAACGTAEQAAYKADPIAAMATEYGPACERGGFARNSPQWRNCIAHSSTRDDLEQQALFYDRYMQWYRLRGP